MEVDVERIVIDEKLVHRVSNHPLTYVYSTSFHAPQWQGGSRTHYRTVKILFADNEVVE